MTKAKNLKVPRLDSTAGQKSFTYQSPHCWKQLPVEVKNSEIVFLFDIAVCKWLVVARNDVSDSLS